MLNISSERGGRYVGKQSPRHPRDIIVELVEAADNPHDRDKLFLEFRRRIAADDNLQNAVDWYFFVNMHDYMTTSRNRKTQKPEQPNKVAENAIAKVVAEQIILLNQEMPNGKRLRYCTLDYIYRLGGVYKRVGKSGSQKRVGEVYSEREYRAKLKGVV